MCCLISDPASNTSPTHSAATFKIDFSSLYNTLGSSLRDDQSTLLLYILIHQNHHMKAFMLSRTNIDQLVSTSQTLHMRTFMPGVMDEHKPAEYCVDIRPST